ncbi:L-histidine N(alpha)-methyltransferase [Bythopirellula goksoeyrii]|uniref:Histidine-specific methyltransferase EgtD n=1 Tax=Bythopirellula goksoeyrii TaxID=1400387 RepID=A0A5B9QHS9_9BACT|nr:L-histidine N(alpha)-methyltransferase [Bythopirellula goksoeyrii]QEG36546.1 Histidine-specific methyltransferase EgtD [Bythopirellula goksoeyrii]
MHNSDSATTLVDLEPSSKQFLSEVIEGLKATPKRLPCKYFYDERGSQLFDQICLLEEYYLTRCEDQIIKEFAQEMADQIGPGVMLVEYGSGSSTKTRALLDRLADPVAYVPVDISREHLAATAAQLSEAYPHIEVLPVCADFTEAFTLPESRREPTHSAVFFPGSTIGNFEPSAARAMLSQIAELCGRGGGLLIGIDLQKDISVIEAAYNDARGVTADFNRNLLERINRELAGEFDINQFRHRAVYDDLEERVEISLVSCSRQRVTIGDQSFRFDEGESIITEHSHKYTIVGFAKLAAQVGLTLRRSWTDPQERFAVLHLALLD